MYRNSFILFFFFLAANIESPGAILNSLDDNDTSFIDTLIAKEQKIAISQYVVQQYLQEIWQGHLKLKAWQFLLFFASFVLLPPIWFIFSMPVEKGLNKVPVIKVPHILVPNSYILIVLHFISAVYVVSYFSSVFYGIFNSNLRCTTR